ncbi:MAG: hypothetical protein K2P81_05535 [Bacteriovoracaceae bacterium]|nr:hypothetical protein [Bacteriovoracaceae bacterium]
MKKLLFALVFVSMNVFAVETKIAEIQTTNTVKADFDYDQNSQRAWVELTIVNPDSDSTDDYERVKVPGMRLEGDTVVYDVEGQRFECAKLRRGGIFRTLFLKATGECKFKTKGLKVSVDDGYRVYKVWVTQVLLVTNR